MLRFGEKPLEGRLRTFVINGDQVLEFPPIVTPIIYEEMARIAEWRKRVNAKNEAARD